MLYNNRRRDATVFYCREIKIIHTLWRIDNFFRIGHSRHFMNMAYTAWHTRQRF